MDTWIDTKNELDQLTLEGHTDTDTFSAHDDLENLSPTEDPILKYSNDPPVLVACVTFSKTKIKTTDPMFQCDGCHRKREDNGRGVYLLI
jgi:hypothetical protein